MPDQFAYALVATLLPTELPLIAPQIVYTRKADQMKQKNKKNHN